MDRRRATLGAAVVGVAAGAVALAFVATPAGAGQSPTLPPTTPDALVASVLTSSVPAMAGTVQIDNNLGLPAVPGMDLPQQLTDGTSDIRVWTDGHDRTRISIPAPTSEQTVVDNGTTLYEWDSSDRTVIEHTIHQNTKPATNATTGTPDMRQDADPATAAKDLISAVQSTSTVSVDGTDLVANRPAYDLVLTPKPSERTLLREVRIAVDAQTHVPLRITVLADNTDAPALQIGFSSLSLGAQDPSLFQFQVPAGATVTNGDKTARRSVNMANAIAPKLVGNGWDSVVVASLPNTGNSANGPSPLAMVQQFGKPVHGTWGSGWLVNASIGNALITSDGRIAVGFVPEQVLYQALESK
jgi:outer membrane lipoprotein-sorting protein